MTVLTEQFNGLTAEEKLKKLALCRPTLLRYVRQFVNSPEEADDITQETFARACLFVKKGNSIEHPKAFLFHIARNLAFDQNRKNHHAFGGARSMSSITDRDDFPDPWGNPEREAHGEQMRRNLDALIRKTLNHDERAVLVLRFIQGHSVEEVGQILQVNENTVKVRALRALDKLKKAITKASKKAAGSPVDLFPSRPLMPATGALHHEYSPGA